ncbi:MAG TPA: DUF389 domain-containing protein [Miltoncostaea sp.]|nr:DUF389 domain-containing protein [Miltoncostaea sp.]
MIRLEVLGRAPAMTAVAESLDALDGVTGVRLVHPARGPSMVSATVRPRAVDPLLEALHGQGVADADITLTRGEVIGAPAGRPAEASLVWAEVFGTARTNARPFARYLAFMFVAGVIACYGVVDDNVILIVGAMAVSPDLLPITAVAVGLATRHVTLAARAATTLALGLAVATLSAALFAFGQDRFDRIPAGFDLGETGTLGGLTSVNDETVFVALAAGVAGMLAVETRASAGVGVAISVTTIPAVAFLGVAAGLGEAGTAGGALRVLGTNVGMMVVGAVGTLAIQRVVQRRWRRGGTGAS